MQTISAEEFKRRYGETTAETLPKPELPKSYPQRVVGDIKSDLNRRVERFGEITNRPDTGFITKKVQQFGQGAGLASDVFETAVGEIPGVKQAITGLGYGISFLTEAPPIKALGELIGSNKVLQSATELYDSDPSFRDTVDAVANMARLGTDTSIAVNSANFASNVTNKIIRKAKDVVVSAEPLATKAGVALENITNSGNIMNRVARLKPSDATEFQRLAGKTHGQYLAETGNFGSPDKIVQKEAIKFVNSKNSVDTELAKLPGLYKDGSIKDALTGLLEKARSVSSQNVPSPYLRQVETLVAKYNKGGLTMEEINTIKRLYERNVKLGYNRLINAEKVEQATNIDSALRKWQVDQAGRLGFTNITKLNKQTQLSKFIIDKLGDEVIGKSGLNAVNLTDWIVLSGGNPQAVAGFLAKKFFSSKAIQAKIAEMLNKEGISPAIQAEVNMTPESLIRSVFPQGTLLELPAPATKYPPTNLVPIIQRGASTIEAQAKNIAPLRTYNPVDKQYYQKGVMGGGVTQTKQTTPQQLGKGKSTSFDINSFPKELQPLVQEARKYKSAEEFVKAQTGANLEIGKTFDETLGKSIDFKIGNANVRTNIRETPNEIYLNTIGTRKLTNSLEELAGSGKGTEIINKLKEYADLTGKKLIIPDATNKALPFWKKFGWLKEDYGVKVPLDGKQYNPPNTFSYTPKSQLTDIWNKANGKK